MNFLNKYISFEYRSFIGPLIKRGRYKLTTFDDQDVPIISTTFYIDGDALNEINTVDGQILAELHPDKLDAHFNTIKKQAGSIEILSKQIQALAVLIASVIPFISPPYDHLNIKLGISGIVALIIFLVRKMISKGFIRLIGKLFQMVSIAR